MSAGTKADSEGTLVRPNQVNDQVNDFTSLEKNVTTKNCEHFLNW